MSEHHAQNVARGHKAAINNPNVSEEAKDNSRRALAELEGSENPEDFTASVGSHKSESYDAHKASELGNNNDSLRFQA
ncbi:hypothetical protein DAEQUDRAFT_722497 [Daedalea quercina L-15889]|uniref:Conidiation protein 6 n=1 Tax=Daedalea quercina L-15889 TaxID=1314783 RepID=A0A165T3C6_9APHY|nr:hypothetical protein DAEQUDRAFT_722497 [Daedalea quercina L-15889]